ncbi:hypothetical protein DPMN_039752 [Dreissena polymorpha]|uniref:Uncharacterized protein n=1 Tax=Dreissena polymorpha TaxID=45954 RepID=A0A9D4CWJ5_DREPO|nr:hypothetical protein DPMN_039752 [Dreissena polymorpha]
MWGSDGRTAASLTMEKGDSYTTIAEHYGQATFGFDGYEDDDETKVNHSVKAKKQNAYVKKKDFWSHDRNKAGMIDLISTTLTKMGCYVVLSSGDADVEIVVAPKR